MSDIAKLHVKVTGASDAADAMERLANAAERVADALDRLNGQDHGGISFVAVGGVTKMEVTPRRDPVAANRR